MNKVEHGVIRYMRPLWNVWLKYSNGRSTEIGFFCMEDATAYLKYRMGNGTNSNAAEGLRSPGEDGPGSSNSSRSSNKRITNERAGILPMDARS